ncbi:MAG: PqqD family protein [Caldilineales bacterium]
MTIEMSDIPIHHPVTASRVFSGQALVITPAANTVRMFNPTGSRIWKLVDGRRSVGEIIQTLMAEYTVDTEQATRTSLEFFAMLEEKQLIHWKKAPV